MLCNSIDNLFHDVHRIADAVESIAEPYSRRIVFGVAVSEQTTPVTPTPHAKRAPKGEVNLMLTLTSSQKAALTVAFKDKKGNPATVDGAPIWGVDNPNVLAITPAADGLSCDVSAVGPLGTALVSVQADADLGEGVVPIAGSLEVMITSGAAETVEITAGAPEEQA